MMRVKSHLRNWDAVSQESKFDPEREPKSQMPVFMREMLWHGLPCPHVPSRRATARPGPKKAPAVSFEGIGSTRKSGCARGIDLDQVIGVQLTVTGANLSALVGELYCKGLVFPEKKAAKRAPDRCCFIHSVLDQHRRSLVLDWTITRVRL